MEDCVFKKISLQDKTLVRIYVTREENSLLLILLQDENTWKSLVTAENLNHFAKQHKLSLENYCEKLVDYIKADGPDIVFVLNGAEFVINRLLDNLKVKYFTCKLEKVNYAEHVEQILDKFYSQNSRYLRELSTLREEKYEIELYATNCELKLKELIKRKNSIEENQLGQFVMILNEKKRRIQHLTELLESFKAGRSTVNPPVDVKTKKNKQKSAPPVTKKETISESEPSEEDTNSSTDDEDNSTEEKPPLNEDCKPSTSAQTYDFLQDDIPESCILPKRVKYGNSTSATVVPTTSKSSPPPVSENESQNTEKSESPTIDISTQQLLDML